jgi:mediator of RNA polymerase II transcription subunit 7
MLDEDETELRNPFPSPPSHYTNYTTHNLVLLSLLRERVPLQEGPSAFAPSEASSSARSLPPVDVRQQYTVLADQKDVPDWPLTNLEPPRVDWILEDGHYMVFGDPWFVRWLVILILRIAHATSFA